MEDKKYHHGDLKQELIEKGLQLLAREGYEGFSMRKLAALCGVSHAAPYKHFAGKEEIVLAVATKVAMEFGSELDKAVNRHPNDPKAQLEELCVQYVRFMTRNPDYFRFVFMTDHGRPIGVDENGIAINEREPLAIAAHCAEAFFRPMNEDGWAKDFLGLWSMLHGYTLMLICHTIVLDDPIEQADRLTKAYLERILVNSNPGSPSGPMA